MRFLFISLLLAHSYTARLGAGVKWSPRRKRGGEKLVRARPIEAHAAAALQQTHERLSPDESAYYEQTMSRRLMTASKRALLLSTDWLRQQNSGFWVLMVMTLVASHSRSRSNKLSRLESIRCQVHAP